MPAVGFVDAGAVGDRLGPGVADVVGRTGGLERWDTGGLRRREVAVGEGV